MLNIVFVHTPMPYVNYGDDAIIRNQYWKNFNSRYDLVHEVTTPVNSTLFEMPHWIPWLAGVLINNGFSSVTALDLFAIQDSPNGIDKDLVNRAIAVSNGEVFLFSPMNFNIHLAIEIATHIKSIRPNSITIFGGVAATPMHVEIALNPYVDFVVKGRGEFALPMLLKVIAGQMEVTSVGNLTFRKPNNELFFSSFSYQHISPEELPYPKFDIFPPEIGKTVKYIRQNYALGCPYECSFCTIQTIGRKPSYFPVSRVISDIRSYQEYYGKHHQVYFGDETFTLNKRRTFEILSALESEGDIFFDCQTRLNHLDYDNLHLSLVKAGCRWIEIGVESFDAKVQSEFKQSTNIKLVEGVLTRLRDVGLPVCTFLVNGLPNQTLDDMKRSIDYACELIGKGLLHASYLSNLVPYVGSKLYDASESFGLKIKHHDYSLYNEDLEPVYETKYAKSAEIYKVYLYGLQNLTSAMSNRPYLNSCSTASRTADLMY